ncbi:MAG: transporter substrate-binding domain-containing protein [Deltaproteobacteria bacterium]|nr:transporter substrate-binding domain-containing protein [Deltaproteobacteria bacterium]MBI3079123.1 transporter substrate-binding domain-containing protein [Deltaproteobacteria bacterium]
MTAHMDTGWCTRTALLSAIVLIASQISGGAFGQPAISPEIAPRGKLRVAILAVNPVLMARKPDGTSSGVAIDLGRFIADRLGVPFEPVLYSSAEAYARSFGQGEWDIALGARGARAELADYGPNFMLVDNLYVAAPGREFADAGQVDRPGVKVAVAKDGAPDRFLSRALRAAEIVRIPAGRVAAIEALRSGKADVYGSNGMIVHAVADGLPGAKVVPGQFTIVPQAIAIPKGRSAAAQGKLAEIVTEAKRTGLVQKAIDQAGVRGVRVAPQ